jgi:Ca2+-binding RTX toxin-like protein
VIYALGGADQVDGKRNNDRIYGGGGDDRVYGGAGAEVFIFGRGARDLLSGSPGADEIIADEFPDTDPGVDTVKGGRGNDTIYASDDIKDKIDCGAGRDFVQFDQGLDTVTNCEDKLPA